MPGGGESVGSLSVEEWLNDLRQGMLPGGARVWVHSRAEGTFLII